MIWVWSMVVCVTHYSIGRFSDSQRLKGSCKVKKKLDTGKFACWTVIRKTIIREGEEY